MDGGLVVLIIYSSVQRTHRPAYVVKQGKHSPSFDVPERIDSILSAVRSFLMTLDLSRSAPFTTQV